MTLDEIKALFDDLDRAYYAERCDSYQSTRAALLRAVEGLSRRADAAEAALVARHGGEPVALLAELDEAREAQREAEAARDRWEQSLRAANRIAQEHEARAVRAESALAALRAETPGAVREALRLRGFLHDIDIATMPDPKGHVRRDAAQRVQALADAALHTSAQPSDFGARAALASSPPAARPAKVPCPDCSGTGIACGGANPVQCDVCGGLGDVPSDDAPAARPSACPVPNCRAGMLHDHNGRASASCPVCDGRLPREQYAALTGSAARPSDAGTEGTGRCLDCGAEVAPAKCSGCGVMHVGVRCWPCHHKRNPGGCAAPFCPEHGAPTTEKTT